MNQFVQTHDLYLSLTLSTSKGAAACPGGNSAAHGILQSLGYLPLEPDSQSDASDLMALRESRLQLLSLAARADCFSLTCPEAPAIEIFGAIMRGALVEPGSNGRAVTAGGAGFSLQRAFEGCMGELAERLSTQETPNDNRLNHRRSVGSVSDLKPVVDTLPGVSLETDAPVDVPADHVLSRRCHSPTFAGPGSSGVAAHLTPSMATASAILELIERDAVALWWFGGRPARPISLKAIAHLCGTRLLDARATSRRVVWFLDLTTEIEIPVIACLSSRDDGSHVVCGFSANCDASRACERAFVEMCQMEWAQGLAQLKQRQLGDHALQSTDRLWIERAKIHTTTSFSQFRGVGEETGGPSSAGPTSTSARLDWLRSQLTARGLTGSIVDLTSQDIGIPVSRVLIPGLQGLPLQQPTPRLVAAAASWNTDLAITSQTLAPL